MLKVAMLSKWHVHAEGYAKQLSALNNVKITNVWDEEPARGSAWAEQLGANFEPDLGKLLKRDDVDAVVVDTPTSLHTEVMLAASEAGKHIFTEKVMAPTVKECIKIADAIQKAGVKFCISFPQRTFPKNLYAKKVIDEKLIGDITFLRIRNAHNGAVGNWLPNYFYDPVLCGGGAMIDLGAHGMYLSRWLMGKPVRVSSTFTGYTEKEVEDNAVSVIEFENKAIAINETSFISPYSPYSLELYGTEGCLLIGGPDNIIKLITHKTKAAGEGWITPSELPEAHELPIKQWVRGITEGSRIHFGVDEGIQLTEMMEAAYLSYREKRQVEFSEIKA